MKPLFFLLFILAAGTTSCQRAQKPETPQSGVTDAAPKHPEIIILTPEQEKTAGITTTAPSLENIATQLQVNGKVDVPTENRITVSMPLGGYVREVSLLPGQNVRKGQVLARLEDPLYIQIQQDYLMARTKLEFYLQDYNRQKRLAAGDATSTKAVQLATSEYQSQQVLVQALAEKVRLLGLDPARLTAATLTRSIPLKAPANGFIRKVNINPGKYVQPADVMIEMVDPSNIHLNLTVFEQDLSKIYIGQPVVAFTTARPDRPHRARIALISRDLNADHSADVHCLFDQYDAALAPGTFMTGEVELSGRTRWVLPQEAVVRDGGKYYVFVEQAPRQYRKQEVQTGSAENGKIAVQWEGFDPAQEPQVVAKGSYDLLMEQKAETDSEE